MKSNMVHSFANVPTIHTERSTFQRNHGHKTTGDCGYLIPIFYTETIPGDTIQLNMTAFGRIATPLYPIMDNLFMETFFFSVPKWQVWEHWKNFIGEKATPTDTTEYLTPQLDFGTSVVAAEEIFDYFGLPKGKQGLKINPMMLRAYNHIYNCWFRDQNLQQPVTVTLGDTGDELSHFTLLKRGKRHDYFTSCLTAPQKGPDLLMSLGTEAPVKGIAKVNQVGWGQNLTGYESGETGSTTYDYGVGIDATSLNSSFYVRADTRTEYINHPRIYTDLSQAVGPKVNEMREIVALQQMMERDARAGTRYNEIIESHYEVDNDGEAWRPEYLGGGSTPVNITPIAVTSNTSTGKLGATGTVGFRGHGFQKSFNDFCIVIGLLNIRSDIHYQQGLDRMWTRRTRWEYPWPGLMNLGEEPVYNKEIYYQGTSEDDEVFGYQERYACERYAQSLITGKLNSTCATSLDAWHLGTEFTDLPTLDDEFIVDDPPLDRCIAVPSEPHFIMDTFSEFRCTRPMPMYSIPGLKRF